MTGRRRIGRSVGALAIGLAVLVGVMLLVTLISTVIWPGQATVTRHLLCDDTHPDAFVVSDTYQTSDGTSTNFTLYCVGARGEADDVGWFRPYVLLALGYAAVTFLVLGAAATAFRLRRRAAAAHVLP